MPFTFSFEEKVDMILIFGESRQNFVQAAQLYAERFPERTHPTRIIFKRIVNSLKETGSLKPRARHVVNRVVTNEFNQALVLNIADNNPQVSTREINEQTGISATSIGRIFKMHSYHPYYIELHQELHGNDFQNRVDFCQWAQLRLRENRIFFKNVLFTDECSFKNSGHVNKHNLYYWSAVNPHWMREQKIQNYWSVNVWGGIINNHLVGPFFFDRHLNGEMYADFLANYLDNLIEDIPLNLVRCNMWFQQDGAPPHFAQVARDVINQQYEGRWIGRGGPVAWPARSPDITPMDFFTWGAVKEIVYRTQPTTPEEMRQRIVNAFIRINEENKAATVQDSFERRLQMCIQTEGHHFEHTGCRKIVAFQVQSVVRNFL